MKKKLFFSGIISILLIFTFMAGCDNGTTTEYVPGPTQYVPSPYPSAVPTEVPIEVPGQSYSALVRALLDAHDALAKNPDETPPDVVVTGQILIARNTTITVPDYITLRINKGARITVEDNAILFIEPRGKVIVHGSLDFDAAGNADDVRQTKLVGELIADGGVIYDKSDAGLLLQYVTAMKNGGHLWFGAGSTAAAGGPTQREKSLLGDAIYEGDGEIRLSFAGGWAKGTPVTDSAAGGTNILTEDPAVGAGSYLAGFEVHGNVKITSRKMTLPEAARAVNGLLLFTVTRGATLEIGPEAAFVASMADETTPTASALCLLVIDETAKVNVSGILQIPDGSTTKSVNKGTITVANGGVLVDDDSAATTPWTSLDPVGTIILEFGSTAQYKRVSAVRKSYIGPGAAAEFIQTGGKATKVTIAPDKFLISGGGTGDTAIIKGAQTIAQYLTINNVSVSADGVLTAGASAKILTVENKAKLTLDKWPLVYTDIKVSGKSEIIVNDATAMSASITNFAVNDSTATITIPATATTLLAGLVHNAGVKPSNGATVNYKGSASYTTAASPSTVNGYNLSFDNSLTLGAAVDLINAGVTVTQGTFGTAAFALSLAGSTLKVGALASAVTGATGISLAAKSTLEIGGTATFTGAAPEVTISDIDSKIVGTAAAVSKITSTSALKINFAAEGNVPGLSAGASPVTIAATNLPATWDGTKWVPKP